MAGLSLKIKQGNNYIIPKFTDCLLDILGGGGDKIQTKVPVDFKLQDDVLLLQSRNGEGNFRDNRSFLQHSHACPIQALAQSGEKLCEEVASKEIAIAVSVILESSDNHILLTQRPSHMRSSPGVWVPPGGHLEKEETLWECGLREVYEETGLDLANNISSLRTLCLWENVFPISITFGKPKFHSLVVYYHVLCRSNHKELCKLMRIDPSEVAAYTWLPANVVSELFTAGDEERYQQKQFVWTDGRVVETELKYMKMFYRVVWTSDSVYSGVQCSLLEWFKDFRSRQLLNKL